MATSTGDATLPRETFDSLDIELDGEMDAVAEEVVESISEPIIVDEAGPEEIADPGSAPILISEVDESELHGEGERAGDAHVVGEDLAEELAADDLVEDRPEPDRTEPVPLATREELELEASDVELMPPRRPQPTPPPAPRPEPKPAPPPEPRAAPPPQAVAAVAAAALTPPAKDKKRPARHWYDEVFDEDYLRTLPFLTPQTTQREASFLIDALGVSPGAQVLDIGCGYGRHAMELAARGYHVAAIDLSLPLLLRGADEAQRRGLAIDFVHGDMREMTYESRFDGAYCVFSTFGYFDDETNRKVTHNVARALKPGGRIVIDVLNRDYVVADVPTRVWWEGDGCVVLEEVDFNYYSSRMVSSRSIVFEDGRQLEQEISIRAYSLHELGKLVHGAGFKVLEVSGGLAARGRFFGSQSRQIILVAEKRSEPPPEQVTDRSLAP